MSEVLSQTTTTNTTRAVVTAAYEAARTMDASAIVGLLHPDVVLHEAASLPNGGTHQGVEDVLQALSFVFETFEMSQLEVEDLIVDGERAVGLVRLPFRSREGESGTVAEVWLVQDGRVKAIRPFYFDTKAIIG